MWDGLTDPQGNSRLEPAVSKPPSQAHPLRWEHLCPCQLSLSNTNLSPTTTHSNEINVLIAGPQIPTLGQDGPGGRRLAGITQTMPRERHTSGAVQEQGTKCHQFHELRLRANFFFPIPSFPAPAVSQEQPHERYKHKAMPPPPCLTTCVKACRALPLRWRFKSVF